MHEGISDTTHLQVSKQIVSMNWFNRFLLAIVVFIVGLCLNLKIF